MYDDKMYVYGNGTIYVCTTNVCYVYVFIDPNIATREYMYVCMYVITHVYDFTESNATTCNYVFHKLFGKRCMFSVLKVTDKIAISTICMTSTH